MPVFWVLQTVDGVRYEIAAETESFDEVVGVAAASFGMAEADLRPLLLPEQCFPTVKD